MNYAACLISAFDVDRTVGRRTAPQTAWITQEDECDSIRSLAMINMWTALI